MQGTSSKPLTSKTALLARQLQTETVNHRTEAERNTILTEHPELKDDNGGFIRELLRRRGVRSWYLFAKTSIPRDLELHCDRPLPLGMTDR